MAATEDSTISPHSEQLALDRQMFLRTVRSMAVALCATVLAFPLSQLTIVDTLFPSSLMALWPPNLLLKSDPSFALLPADIGIDLLQLTSITSGIWLCWVLWNLFYDIKSTSKIYIDGLFKVSLFGILVCLLDALIAYRITDGNSLFTLNVKLGYGSIFTKAIVLIFATYLFVRIFAERIILYIKAGG